MSIESLCQSCGNRLRVADEHAGKLARCPKCQTVYTVPIPDSVGAAATSSVPTDAWRLKTADGMVYGPVSRADMDRWLSEGRVTPQSQLLQEGTDQWQWAGHVYPQLAATSSPSLLPIDSRPAPVAGYNPFSDNAGGPAGAPWQGAAMNNAYAPSMTSGRAFSPNGTIYKPHRGVLVLVFGILAIAICPIFGIPALFIGFSDLSEIKAGRMDPAGKGLAIAGMLLGGIWLVLGLLWLAFIIFAIILQA